MKLLMPQLDFLDRQDVRGDDDVKAQVRALLTTLYPRNDLIERRREVRYPYPCLIHMTPVAEDGFTPTGESVVVVGRHLSEHGLGFYHQHPLPHRRMIASLEIGKGRWFGFIIDLNWCRFTEDGWYESGGRLLQAVNSPMERKS
ncbi:MAG: hypothetical protein JW959_09190 [Pirellulales bacterium]|nr:hypothetical protein [Pirellulales bacterium]